MSQLDGAGESLLRRVLNERLAITAFLRMIVRQRDLAEDLFQDLCVLVMQKQEEVARVDNLGSWLRTAGRNLAMNALRKRANHDEYLGENVHELMEPHWNRLGSAGNADLADALESCLAQLGEAARRIVHSRYVEGMKLVDLARHLDRPVASVYVSMGRIHKKLAECILRKLAIGARDV